MSTEAAGMTSPPPPPDFTAIKQRQRQVWSNGDYNMLGNRILLISELLCEAVDLRAGQRVLDVASGSGNTALAAARRYCDVTSTDFVPRLLERGKKRAEAEGLEITFQEADAVNLPFPDASFDVVLSTVGAMFAPNQPQVASEMLRVCRSGGKIGMANWTPDGVVGALMRIGSEYMPPPPGLQPPLRWGTEEGLHELLGAGTSSIECCRRSYTFRFASPQHYVDMMRTWFGPVKTTFESLDEAGQQRLTDDLIALCEETNISGDNTLVNEGDYLEVVAVKA